MSDGELAMAYGGFSPEEVEVLAGLLREAASEAREKGLVIPEYVLTNRLLSEARRKGLDDREHLKRVALDDGAVAQLRGKWSSAVQAMAEWLRQRRGPGADRPSRVKS